MKQPAQPTLFNWTARKKGPKPNGFARALAIVVRCGQQVAVRAAPPEKQKECPRCHHVGEVQRDFGTRVIRGEVRPQSWCRQCRKATAPAARGTAPQLELIAGGLAGSR